MTRPTAREFTARWREFRPTSTGVVVMTIATILLRSVSDWPLWACVVIVIAAAAALAAGFAALELWGETPDQDAEPEDAEPDEEWP